MGDTEVEEDKSKGMQGDKGQQIGDKPMEVGKEEEERVSDDSW